MNDFRVRVLLSASLALMSFAVTESALAATINCATEIRCDGTKQDDTMIGTDGADEMRGHEGRDVIRGKGGPDFLHAGPVDDTPDGEFADGLVGGPGDDELRGGSGDALWGGTGNDQIHGRRSTYMLGGGFGDDVLYGGSGNNYYFYGDSDGGSDLIVDSADLLEGRVGNFLWVGIDASALRIDLTSDETQHEVKVVGGPSTIDWADDAITNVLSGSERDVIRGNADPNAIRASGGDKVYGRRGADMIHEDLPFASSTFFGGPGSDTIRTAEEGIRGERNPDVVDCGPGKEDEVTYDQYDTIINCEILHLVFD